MRRLFTCILFIAMSFLFFTAPLTATTANGTKTNSNNNKLIALTFDDGPSDSSAWLLNQLKARNVHVTFFVCGKKVEKYGAVIERAVADGHQVANHSWDHAYLDTLDKTAFNNEILNTDKVLTAVTGQTNFLLRPPYGNYNANVLAWANRPLINWSIDTYDWAIHSQSDLTNRIVQNAKDGSIILMHETVPTTAQGVVDAIDILQKQGYTFVTVNELFARKGITLKNGVDYTCAPNNGIDYGKTDTIDPFYYDESQLPSHWAYANINYVRNQRLMVGVNATKFAPEYPMTRAMFATVLARMSGESLTGYNNNFNDISNNTWYTNAIAWAASKNIVYGSGNGNFSPNDYVTKQEVCVMMSRYAVYKDVTFSSDYTMTYADTQLINDWAKAGVAAMTKANVVSGRTSRLGTAFDPQKYATRAEVATIITKFITAMNKTRHD